MSNKIVTALWFHTDGGKLAPLIEYYKGAFGDAFVPAATMPLGETPSGYAEMCFAAIFGQTFSIMTTAQAHDSMNDAMALVINCDGQEEIDHYWDYFTKEGKESQCGWCIDRYGLRWQVIPSAMGELMARPGAWEVMMKQKKIIIAEY